MNSIRVATWNTKQGVAPRQPAPVLWEWIARVSRAQVLVLTEARVTKNGGIPPEWQAAYTPGGLGPKRQFGTIIAARDAEIRRASYRRTGPDERYPNPVTSFAVEVHVDGELELLVMGAYGLLDERGNGFRELVAIAKELEDLRAEYGDERIVVAGDLNLWPSNVLPVAESIGLVDVTSQRASFPHLDSPRGESRIWTHKNGNKNGNGARQELDFILVSEDLADCLHDIKGGVDDFPDAWDMSDHAPVAVTVRR